MFENLYSILVMMKQGQITSWLDDNADNPNYHQALNLERTFEK